MERVIKDDGTILLVERCNSDLGKLADGYMMEGIKIHPDGTIEKGLFFSDGFLDRGFTIPVDDKVQIKFATEWESSKGCETLYMSGGFKFLKNGIMEMGNFHYDGKLDCGTRVFPRVSGYEWGVHTGSFDVYGDIKYGVRYSCWKKLEYGTYTDDYLSSGLRSDQYGNIQSGSFKYSGVKSIDSYLTSGLLTSCHLDEVALGKFIHGGTRIESLDEGTYVKNFNQVISGDKWENGELRKGMKYLECDDVEVGTYDYDGMLIGCRIDDETGDVEKIDRKPIKKVRK
jgi:hypothetical protein